MTAPRRVKVTGDLFHGQVPDGAVYVGRAAPGLRRSPFANPFTIREHGTAAAAVYRQWLSGQPGLIGRARAELAGHDLACWCPLPACGEPDDCHAAVLLAVANGQEP